MPQHFIKIEIKGDESKLPEDGWFLVKFSNGIISEEHFDMTVKKEWLTEVEWYEIPVPEPQQLEQLESAELNRDDLKRFKMFPERVKELTGVDAEIYVFTFDQLNELFSSQSHNNTVIGPSDSEILKEANKLFPRRGKPGSIINECNYTGRKGFAKGAKYALSQCKAIDLRATLIKYDKSIYYDIHTEETSQKLVDDYLSARKERE